MPRAADTVDQAATLLRKRIAELDEERKRLERALSGLGGRRGPGRPRGSTTRRRRGRRGGTRADQAMRIITQNPGITVTEIAKRMRLKAPNYLYRLMPDLERDGRVRRRGRGYHPASK
jgi:hypothetical protein